MNRPDKNHVIVYIEEGMDDEGRYRVSAGGYTEWWTREKILDQIKSNLYTWEVRGELP